MRFKILPSPSANIALRHYREGDRAAFHFLSDALPGNSPLQRIADHSSDFSTAIIFENRSEKEITALRYCWSMRDATARLESTRVEVTATKLTSIVLLRFSQSRQLLSVSGRLDVDQGLYDHVLAGGGVMGAGASAGGPFSDATEEVTFEIELVVFADGEIAGPDPNQYAVELQGRKRAAEYVAKHVRLAKLEERDPIPVVAALRDMPHLRSEVLAHLVSEYARTYSGNHPCELVWSIGQKLH